MRTPPAIRCRPLRALAFAALACGVALPLAGCKGEQVSAAAAELEMLNNASRPEGVQVGTRGTLRAAGWIRATRELYDVTLDSSAGLMLTARRADVRADAGTDELSIVLRDVTWVDATADGDGEIRSSERIVIGPWPARADLVD